MAHSQQAEKKIKELEQRIEQSESGWFAADKLEKINQILEEKDARIKELGIEFDRLHQIIEEQRIRIQQLTEGIEKIHCIAKVIYETPMVSQMQIKSLCQELIGKEWGEGG